jgi:xanthosine phosphorylase
MKISDLHDTLSFIQQQKPGFKPKLALILGSGLGDLANQIQDAVKIPFGEIPLFPRSTVAGHKGQLVLGSLGKMPVACMQGRIHGYEGGDSTVFMIFIRTLKLLGCEILIITNASGSLRKEVGTGQLSLITDHINLQHRNPLIGPNDDEFGPRFFAMTDAYDPALNKRIHQVAQQLAIPLHEGVYVGLTGPCFETAAEIRALRTLGGDLVGMSTVPEVLIAKHCSLRVAAIASVTNLAADISKEVLSHEVTLQGAHLAATNLSYLIVSVLESLVNDPC